MEKSCTRCHNPVESDARFCAVCGLPQLEYSDEGSLDAGQPVHWNDAVRDAGSIAWRPALQYALRLAIPTGILCAFLAPEGILGLILMGVTSLWVVSLYMRSQRPPWMTMGAGARLGLVTGIVGSWTTAATVGLSLFATRFWLHQGAIFDNFWQGVVGDQLTQEWSSMGMDAQTIAQAKSWLLSPGGRAAWVLCAMGFFVALLMLFAVAGGALAARIQARAQRPRV